MLSNTNLSVKCITITNMYHRMLQWLMWKWLSSWTNAVSHSHENPYLTWKRHIIYVLILMCFLWKHRLRTYTHNVWQALPIYNCWGYSLSMCVSVLFVSVWVIHWSFHVAIRDTHHDWLHNESINYLDNPLWIHSYSSKAKHISTKVWYHLIYSSC